MQGNSRKLSVALYAAALAVATQSSAATNTDDRYQQALDGVLGDVANPEKSFELVEAAIAAGDLRGAAASLERILLIDPRLANIRLELGVLYLRMGNGALAQYHIREALRAPNVPETVRLRAERLLAQSGAAGRRNTFRFESSLGYRHDSNASAGPSADAVWVLDPFTFQPVLAPLTSGGETEDLAMDVALNLSHSFAFSGKRGSSWDSDAFAYGVRYQDLDALDQYSYGVETGPTLVVAGSSEAPVSLRPLAMAGIAVLDSEDYFDYTGYGLELSGFWSPATVTRLRATVEDRKFDDSPSRFLSDRSGDYLTSRLEQIWQLGRVQFSAALKAQDVSAAADYQSFSYLGGELGVRYFGSAGFAQRPWNVYLDLSYGTAEYDGADFLIHPDIVREDDRRAISAGIEVSVTRSVALTLDLTRSDTESTLPNYEYDNFSASVRMVVRF